MKISLKHCCTLNFILILVIFWYSNNRHITANNVINFKLGLLKQFNVSNVKGINPRLFRPTSS